jgi:hypothetical protein
MWAILSQNAERLDDDSCKVRKRTKQEIRNEPELLIKKKKKNQHKINKKNFSPWLPSIPRSCGWLRFP